LSILLGLLLVVSIFFHYGLRQVNSPLQLDSVSLFTVQKGTSFYELTKRLVANGWLDNRFWLRNYARLNPELTKIKAGTYQLTPGITGLGLLEKLVAGQEHQFRLTFVEGSQFKDWLSQLADNPYLTHQLPEDNQQILALLAIEASHPEGLFFPDTYAFTAGTTDKSILKRAYLKMQQALDRQWQSRSPGLPYKSPYEALIMASIIEKETGVASERSLISSVFINRLARKMRLQTDPTVIYGLGDDFDGDITFAHLRQKTPYNTYKINGLPPTPIAMPGLEAIVASLHPQASDYLYFVSKGNGEHYFSRSLKEHNQAVKKYQLRKQRDKHD
jgi:UPF0755 protein